MLTQPHHLVFIIMLKHFVRHNFIYSAQLIPRETQRESQKSKGQHKCENKVAPNNDGGCFKLSFLLEIIIRM